MKIEDLVARVGPDGLFRTGQILGGERSPADVRSQLNRWVKSGRVLRLRRGVYALGEPYRQKMAHPFTVANALKKASYVSLQSALAHYGMIPEYVPVTTSVTTGRPEELETPAGRFQFRHVAGRLFDGFSETEVSPGEFALLASPYKALVDLLYLTPGGDQSDYLDELRLSPPEHFAADTLRASAQRSGSVKVRRAVERLLQLWADGGEG
jgi:predicted transcriptional regulator of viral defense system